MSKYGQFPLVSLVNKNHDYPTFLTLKFTTVHLINKQERNFSSTLGTASDFSINLQNASPSFSVFYEPQEQIRLMYPPTPQEICPLHLLLLAQEDTRAGNSSKKWPLDGLQPRASAHAQGTVSTKGHAWLFLSGRKQCVLWTLTNGWCFWASILFWLYQLPPAVTAI